MGKGGVGWGGEGWGDIGWGGWGRVGWDSMGRMCLSRGPKAAGLEIRRLSLVSSAGRSVYKPLIG